MKKNTKILKIPSILFTKKFITNVGTIIEKEKIEKVKLIEEQIKKTTDRIELINLEYQLEAYHVDYTIRYKDETTIVSSIDELANVLSEQIEFQTFIARVYSYKDDDFLDTNLRISIDNPDSSEVEFSSNDADKVIVVTEKLKEIFNKNKTFYSLYYNLSLLYRSIIDGVIVTLVAILFLIFVVKFIHISENFLSSIASILLFTMMFTYNNVRRKLIPYIKFKKSSGKLLAFLTVGIGGLFWSFVYDVIKNIYSK